MHYTLYKVEDDGSRTKVSTHPTAYEGITEGARIIEYVDHNYSYELVNGGGPVTKFRPNRVHYREWARRNGYIHSLDDRYDHDVDELLSR